MTKLDIMEGALFTLFVVATDSLVAINMGWALLMKPWNPVLLGVVHILGLATLAGFLAFVFLEDYLRSRRCGADAFQP
jgi:uncharacterized membrane protein